MSDVVRIANGSGFFGDRFSGMAEMVEGGPIDVLTGDYLAELTMLILARTRRRRPGGGYARTFVRQLEAIMGTCLDRGIKVVTNAGGLDPGGCAEAIHEVADRLGLAPAIAYVDGDDLMPRLPDLVAAGGLRPFDGPTAEPDTTDPADHGLGDPADYLTANAYFGCWGIVEALNRGADIVVTGRVTDAAVACGPAAWFHGWAADDWDALAGAVVAGHVIECSAQATGGNYSFFTEIPDYETNPRLGFPWAEIADDGSAVIGKHDGTGGLVSVGTVTSQLLYEIGGPAYLGPDVTARFDTISVEQAGPDRVRISGAKGEPPPPNLKVAMNRLGGYRNTVEVALTGTDIEVKAAFAQAAFWDVCPDGPDDYAEAASVVVPTGKPDPETNEEATAVWRITVKDADEEKVGRRFSNAMIETALASIPGFYLLSGPPGPASPFGVYRPATIDRDLAPQYVHVGGGTIEVPSTTPPADPPEWANATEPAAKPPGGPTRSVPLGTVAGARSGDKGGDANLGVFVRGDSAWAWLDEWLTIDRLRALLPETEGLVIDRYRYPNLRALNFVIRGLLGEGVAAATRKDAQAKSLGEWLRARVVEIPEALL